MRQSITRFFLLYTFLLSGFSQLDVRAGHDARHTSSISEKSEDVVVGNEQLVTSPFYSASSSDRKHEVFKIDVTEIREEEESEDEHDLISFKKHLDGSHYFTSAFLALTSGYLSGSNTGVSSFYKNSSYTESYRYLVFLVFMI
jgi:hypothetical protein